MSTASSYVIQSNGLNTRAFEAVQIAFEIFTKKHNLTLAKLPAPDYSLATAHADLVVFIPGVTASLVAFGTSPPRANSISIQLTDYELSSEQRSHSLNTKTCYF